MILELCYCLPEKMQTHGRSVNNDLRAGIKIHAHRWWQDVHLNNSFKLCFSESFTDMPCKEIAS